MKMKRFALLFQSVILVGFVLAVLSFTSCSAEDDRQPPAPATAVSEKKAEQGENRFRSISGIEAQELIRQKKNLLMLDVRTPQERRQIRISNSLLIPIGDVMRGRLDVPKDQPLLVVCAVGGRSYVVGKALLAMGHREVYNLDGGIEAWNRAGLPVETGPEERKTN